MPADYPTDADLQAELEAAGLYDDSWNLDLASAIAAAIGEWEGEVDWGPFLARSSYERNFTLSGERSVRGFGGLAEAPTLVVLDGVELVEGQTYWLEPANALAEGKPITRIDFARRIASRRQGLRITGWWGNCTTLPNDVFGAVLKNAAASLEGTIAPRYAAKLVAAQNASAPIKAKESGPLRVEYAVTDGVKTIDVAKTFAAWRTSYASTLGRYLYKLP